MRGMDLLETSPVIAAIKNTEGMEQCLKSECQIVFVLKSTLSDVAGIVKRLKENGKTVMVHIDLVQGLSAKEIAVDFIHENTEADGIISTKPVLVRRAIDLGMYGILRTFIIDSMALSTTKKQIDMYRPDMVEIMPGIMPSVLKDVRGYTRIPMIASGLITDKKEIMTAFSAGADAISTTKEELWFM